MWMSAIETRIVMRDYRKIIVVIVLLSIYSNCSKYGPVTRELGVHDLTGTWQATEDSRRYLAEKQLCCTDNLTTMVLTADGGADLNNVPDCWAIDSRECKGSLSFKGTWEIPSPVTNADAKRLIFHSTIGQDNFIHPISVLEDRNRHGKLALVFGLGETDIKREIYLEKP